MLINKNTFLLFFLFSNVYARNEKSTQTSSSQPKIEYELYKALVGETVRLECPQPNPTWFFRKFSNSLSNNNVEDIIVTRHGIINSDYKYKIMCHMTLKHKVILINNIDFQEEGLYTCLYTLPSEQVLISKTKSPTYPNQLKNPIQFRYIFNVSVYTLLSGLKMSFFPHSQADILRNQNQLSVKKNENQPIELMEKSLNLKEGDEFSLKCIVESSKPAANIKFMIKDDRNDDYKNEILSLNNNHLLSYLTLSPSTQPPKLFSLISENSNFSKNNDHTFKTTHHVLMKAKKEDNGKIFMCIAENGFSNQKWEIKKTFNVLYAPVCKDPPNFVYFVGINQTVNVECKISSANPSLLSYKWNLDNIKKPNEYKESEHFDFSKTNDIILKRSLFSINTGVNSKREEHLFEEIDLKKSFKWKPTDSTQFGRLTCIATNDIGSTECSYEIKLGGIPNPPTDCTFTLKNTSAIISCAVGFHQVNLIRKGDPDIYCYLLKKSENEVYKEHTRNRESCSFIVNDVNLNKFNEFWIYSSNRYGHNKDLGFHLTIGNKVKVLEPESSKNAIVTGIITIVFIFCIISCCFCFRVKKGLTEDTESISDNEPYHKNNLPGIKEKQLSSTKFMKGNKTKQDFEASDKFLRIDFNYNIDEGRKPDHKIKNELNFERRKNSHMNEKINFPQEKIYVKMVEKNLIKSKSFSDEIDHSINKIITKKISRPVESEITFDLEKKKATSINSINETYFDKNKAVGGVNILNKSENTYSENHTNTTFSTSVSGSSDSNESPNLYFESDGADPCIFRNKLTVSDQNFNEDGTFFQKNKSNRLSSFSDSSSKIYHSPRCFRKYQNIFPITLSSLNQESTVSNRQDYSAKLSESFDGKYLNKLCEDIEVSLNVDCADDYSINDYSGDYSFDNGWKTPIYSSIKNKQFFSRPKMPEMINDEKILNLSQNQSSYFQNNSEFSSFKKKSFEKEKINNMGVLV